MTDALLAFTDTLVVVKLGKAVKMTVKIVVLGDQSLLEMDGETGGFPTNGVVCNGMAVKSVVLGDRSLLEMDGETGGFPTNGVVCNGMAVNIVVLDGETGGFPTNGVVCNGKAVKIVALGDRSLLGMDGKTGGFSTNGVVCNGKAVKIVVLGDRSLLGMDGETVGVATNGVVCNVADFVIAVSETVTVVIGSEVLNDDDVVCIISDPNELLCTGNKTFVVVKLGEMIEKSAVTLPGLVDSF